jgi:hypothetical protein
VKNPNFNQDFLNSNLLYNNYPRSMLKTEAFNKSKSNDLIRAKSRENVREYTLVIATINTNLK